jgi:hypothetical protein
MWYELAAAQGDTLAASDLAYMQARMSEPEVAEAQRMARAFMPMDMY